MSFCYGDAQSLNNLAVVRKDMGQQAEAKRLFEDAVRMYVACNNNSEDSAEVAAAYNNLAGCLHDMVCHFSESGIKCDICFTSGSQQPRCREIWKALRIYCRKSSWK